MMKEIPDEATTTEETVKHMFVTVHELMDSRIVVEGDEGHMRVYKQNKDGKVIDPIMNTMTFNIKQCFNCEEMGESGLPCQNCEDQNGLFVCEPLKGKCLVCQGEGCAYKDCVNGCLVRSTYLPPSDYPSKCEACGFTDKGSTNELCIECEAGKMSENSHGQIDHIFLNGPRQINIPGNWILLDNQSTVNVFCNASLLRNIRKVKRKMIIHCNAGVSRTNLIGDLPGYLDEVWYNPTGIANILSLSKVKKRYRVTFDSECTGRFVVHKDDGSTREFQESPTGLYYFVADDYAHHEVTLLSADAGNKSRYSNRSIDDAVDTLAK